MFGVPRFSAAHDSAGLCADGITNCPHWRSDVAVGCALSTSNVGSHGGEIGAQTAFRCGPAGVAMYWVGAHKVT